MNLALAILSWAALLAGGFFIVVSAVGLHRLPDFFSRTHAASLTDTVGVGFLAVGMLLQTEDWGVAVRLVVIVVLLYTSGAVAVHALARAALHQGERPLLAGSDGKLRPTEVGRIYPDLGRRLEQPLVSEHSGDVLPVPSAGRAGLQAPAPADEREDRRWNS